MRQLIVNLSLISSACCRCFEQLVHDGVLERAGVKDVYKVRCYRGLRCSTVWQHSHFMVMKCQVSAEQVNPCMCMSRDLPMILPCRCGLASRQLPHPLPTMPCTRHAPSAMSRAAWAACQWAKQVLCDCCLYKCRIALSALSSITSCCSCAGALHTSKSGHSSRGMDSQRAGVFESNGAPSSISVP